MRKLLWNVLLITTMVILAGCGGGGGASPPGTTSQTSPTGTAGDSQTTPNPAAATLVLSTTGVLPPETSISGISIGIDLPAGVTVGLNESGDVDAGVIVPSGVAAGKATVGPVIFVPAAAGKPARLNLVVTGTDNAGLGTGEFATIHFIIANGSSPAATDFGTADFEPVDSAGADIPTGPGMLQASFTVDLK